MQMEDGQCSHLSLYHVDPPWAKSLHAVVDVDHPFSLSHVQHDVNDYKTACTPCSSTAEMDRKDNIFIFYEADDLSCDLQYIGTYSIQYMHQQL